MKDNNIIPSLNILLIPSRVPEKNVKIYVKTRKERQTNGRAKAMGPILFPLCNNFSFICIQSFKVLLVSEKAMTQILSVHMHNAEKNQMI